jgi:hypothetical protein
MAIAEIDRPVFYGRSFLSETISEGEGEASEFLSLLFLGITVVVFAEVGQVCLPGCADGDTIGND